LSSVVSPKGRFERAGPSPFGQLLSVEVVVREALDQLEASHGIRKCIRQQTATFHGGEWVVNLIFEADSACGISLPIDDDKKSDSSPVRVD